jgi:hypothetical protein
MSHSVAISDDTYSRLLQKARRLALSPDAVAEDLLRRELDDTGSAWRADMEKVIARIGRHAESHTAVEIEADITEAAAEARAIRRDVDRRH